MSAQRTRPTGTPFLATSNDPSGWPRLDWSMDAALLLAALASRAGDHVDFLAHDRVTRAAVFNASRTDLLAQLVGAMAPVGFAFARPDRSSAKASLCVRTTSPSRISPRHPAGSPGQDQPLPAPSAWIARRAARSTPSARARNLHHRWQAQY